MELCLIRGYAFSEVYLKRGLTVVRLEIRLMTKFQQLLLWIRTIHLLQVHLRRQTNTKGEQDF